MDGEDHIEGGEGNDTVYAATGDGNDTIAGDSGDDVFLAAGQDGDDRFAGGGDNDTYVSAADDGHDVFEGLDGHDVFIAVNVGDADTFDGGEGTDTYDASAIDSAIIIDLTAGTVTLIEAVDGDQSNLILDIAPSVTLDEPSAAEQEVPSLFAETEPSAIPNADPEIKPTTLISVENVIGGSANDVFIANDEVNEFTGGDGEDLFVFQTVASTGSGSGGRDKILDFEVGDRIKIDDISDEFAEDFNTTFEDPGIRKFVLIGLGQDFTRPGEVRFKYDEDSNATILEGNVDFDADTEFQIEILGDHDLKYDSYVYST
jgi:Ca2+-binding RTX toxin-like protein